MTEMTRLQLKFKDVNSQASLEKVSGLWSENDALLESIQSAVNIWVSGSVVCGLSVWNPNVLNP